MPSVDITERDLRRDEARLLSILTGGSPSPDADLPSPAPRRPRVPAWAAALVLTVGAAGAGLGLRALLPRAAAPAPVAPVQSIPPAAEPVPPLPRAAQPPTVPPALVPNTAIGLPRTEPTRPRPVARHRSRLTLDLRPDAEPPRAAPPAQPPRPAASRWIAEPLSGDALERARAEDATKTRALNRGELSTLPPGPDR